MKNRISNFGFAVIGGAAVFTCGVAGLVAIIGGLCFQLRQEERHFRFATEKALTMAELNHHVRNAVFPLVLAIERTQDPDSNRLANEAMSRLDSALRDAAIDAYSGKIRYTEGMADRVAA